MTMILGIDPGLDGAIAVLTEAGELLEIHDMPTLLDGARGRFDRARRPIAGKEGRGMTDNPKVLVPFDRREAITLRQAALIAGRSESTLRS